MALIDGQENKLHQYLVVQSGWEFYPLVFVTSVSSF